MADGFRAATPGGSRRDVEDLGDPGYLGDRLERSGDDPGHTGKL